MPSQINHSLKEAFCSGKSNRRWTLTILEPETKSLVGVEKEPPQDRSPTKTVIILKEDFPYRIIKKLGKGGMGEVYLAEDIKLRRQVVLKRLLPEYSSREDLKARFLHEALAAAALNHPNIVTIHEIVEHNDITYIVMEYVKGESLWELIRRESLSIEKVKNIAIQICEGLRAAHREGVVHRDIKPQNILIRQEDGLVKIADFGLAKLQGVPKLTAPDTILGTVDYMSPEQISGMDVDHRSDIFSFGVMLYEMLTGQLPFAREKTAAILHAILNATAPPLTKYRSDIPEALQKIVNKALVKNFQERYQKIEYLLAGLRQIDLPIPPPPQLWLKAIVAILTLIVMVVFVVFLVQNKDGPQTTLPISTKQDSATVFLNSDTADTASKKIPILRPPVFGGVRIKSSPPDAMVWLNNKIVGKTPFEDEELKAGRYRLQISADAESYAAFTDSITVRSGQITPFEASLTALGGLSITSKPESAEVFLSGKKTGLTPYQDSKLPVGRYNLVLQKENYKDYPKAIVIEHRQMSQFNFDLVPRLGRLEILVKPFGSISIDDTLRRGDADFKYATELAAGRHRVEAVHPLLGRWKKEVTIEPEKAGTLLIDFTKKVKLTVSSEPWGEIFVDDNPTGDDTPKELELTVGLHVIEVKRPGYVLEGGAKQINLEEGIPASLKFILKKVP